MGGGVRGGCKGKGWQSGGDHSLIAPRGHNANHVVTPRMLNASACVSAGWLRIDSGYSMPVLPLCSCSA